MERFLNQDAYSYIMGLIDDLGGVDLEQLQADMVQVRAIAEDAANDAETAVTTANGAVASLAVYDDRISDLSLDVAACENSVSNLQIVSNSHTTDIAALQSGKVPITRKVNNKALSADITLDASDVSAAPTSHASTATTYGAGTTASYGHNKLINNLNQNAYANGEALSAYQGYVLNTNKADKTLFKDYGTSSTFIQMQEVDIGTSVQFTAGEAKTFTGNSGLTYGANNKIAIGIIGFEMSGTNSSKIAIGRHWVNVDNQNYGVSMINTDGSNAITVSIKMKLLVVNYGI